MGPAPFSFSPASLLHHRCVKLPLRQMGITHGVMRKHTFVNTAQSHEPHVSFLRHPAKLAGVFYIRPYINTLLRTSGCICCINDRSVHNGWVSL